MDVDYYEIETDYYEFPHQHFITEIQGFDNPKAQMDWDEFYLAYRLNKHQQYIATIESGSEEVDFTTTFYGFCVISEKFKRLLEQERISDMMIIPLSFERKLSQPFYLVMDYLRSDCVDETHSEFQKFVENDPVRPDLAGWYSAFFKLIIDATKTEGYDFFRLEKAPSVIIASQTIKDIYDTNGLTGARFTKVTLD